MKLLNKIIIIMFLLSLCWVGNAGVYAQRLRYNLDDDVERPYEYNRTKVETIINGHTIRLEDKTTLKLIGIETPLADNSRRFYSAAKKMGVSPEVMQVMGNEATRYLEELLAGATIRVEYDKQPKNLYGMIQGYVYRVDNKKGKKKEELFINLEIMKSGYSKRVDSTPNLKCDKVLGEAYEKAKKKAIGMWKQWLE